MWGHLKFTYGVPTWYAHLNKTMPS